MLKEKNDYSAFLAGSSVLGLACELLPVDEDLHNFIVSTTRKGIRAPDGTSLSEPLPWFLFEEIGWPEGRGYYMDASCGDTSYYLVMIRKSDAKISRRLELRRERWKKPNKVEFLSAHNWLLSLLNTFLESRTQDGGS